MTEEMEGQVEEKSDADILYPETDEKQDEVKEEGDEDVSQQEDGQQEDADEEEGGDEEADEEEGDEDESSKEKDDEKEEELDGQLKFEVKDIENPNEEYIAKEDIERIVTEGKKLGLSKEQVQWAVQERAETLSGLAEAFESHRVGEINEWRETTNTDKEIGGENLERSISRANLFLDKYGTPEARELLREGMGNHPEVIRILSRAGAAMEGDSFVTGGKHTRNDDKSYEEVFYGSSN